MMYAYLYRYFYLNPNGEADEELENFEESGTEPSITTTTTPLPTCKHQIRPSLPYEINLNVDLVDTVKKMQIPLRGSIAAIKLIHI